jgi:hypothetical protein
LVQHLAGWLCVVWWRDECSLRWSFVVWGMLLPRRNCSFPKRVLISVISVNFRSEIYGLSRNIVLGVSGSPFGISKWEYRSPFTRPVLVGGNVIVTKVQYRRINVFDLIFLVSLRVTCICIDMCVTLTKTDFVEGDFIVTSPNPKSPKWVSCTHSGQKQRRNQG